MRKIVAAWKLFVFGLIVILYGICACTLYISTFDPVKRRWRLIKNTNRIARLILFVFRVEVICRNPIPPSENSLVIGNHVGFIDIMCLNAIQPCVFITSLEIKRTPFLGQLSMLSACAYVDRQNRSHIQDELKDIVKTLQQGFRVVLYAEAKTSNGEQVLPFKKTLMMAAGFAKVPIRPFAFNYLTVNGRPIEYKDRDNVCWYGDQSFFSAIWRSLQLKKIQCEVDFLDHVYITPDDDRTEVSVGLHDKISARHKPFKPPFNLNG